MTLETLNNIRAMMNRVPVTGPEAVAWCQAAAALDAEIAKASAPPAPPAQPPPVAHLADL